MATNSVHELFTPNHSE